MFIETPETTIEAQHLSLSPTPRHEIFVGRQPIFDRLQNVIGYELLFRSTARSSKPLGSEDDEATARTMLSAFLEIGLETITAGRPAFINVTRKSILEDYISALPPERVVLEVLEDVTVDGPLAERLEQLADAGYRIALDDFTEDDPRASLLEIAHLVKVDLRRVDADRLSTLIGVLRNRERLLIAEKVETREEFGRCKELGFDGFQGFFLCRPSLVRGRRSPATQLSILDLVARLQNPDVAIREIESVFKHDATLSYKLLQLVNSALIGNRRRISSIKQALVQLGVLQVSAWATVLLLSRLNDKPHELLTIAIVRGYMCEGLVHRAGVAKGEGAFLVGFLSVLDAMLDRPLGELLLPLPLSPPVLNAICYRRGRLGQALNCAVSFERGEWAGAAYRGLNPGMITEAYVNALRRASDLQHLLARRAGARDHSATT